MSQIETQGELAKAVSDSLKSGMTLDEVTKYTITHEIRLEDSHMFENNTKSQRVEQEKQTVDIRQ
jgi:hypothetical protein